MATVKVEWDINMIRYVGGDRAAKWVVTFGVMEQEIPIAENSATFQNVAAGSYQFAITVCESDGHELLPPVTGSVTVPADEDPLGPSVINARANIV